MLVITPHILSSHVLACGSQNGSLEWCVLHFRHSCDLPFSRHDGLLTGASTSGRSPIQDIDQPFRLHDNTRPPDAMVIPKVESSQLAPLRKREYCFPRVISMQKRASPVESSSIGQNRWPSQLRVGYLPSANRWAVWDGALAELKSEET